MNPYRHRNDLSLKEALNISWEGAYKVERLIREDLDAKER